ncbi:MAG: PD40 domain-containing protein [Hahellaceae bacterium]|nr:PD40 domain-containing protein [Hahellaceae bacterium]
MTKQLTKRCFFLQGCSDAWLLLRRLLLIAIGFVLHGCGGSVGGGGETADPVIQALPVLYVKRPVLSAEGNPFEADLRQPAAFNPGARLYLKAQASPSVKSVDLSELIFPAAKYANDDGVVHYDVKHLSLSFDGQRVVFAARAPELEDTETTWNIWEYSLHTGLARRVITSDIVADDGDDLFPAFLPDGRIVFSSTRQRQSKARLLDEGKPQFSALDEDRRSPALNLHTMSPDGASIEQITFNQSHDTNPVVMDDGTIAFVRWDNAGSKNEMNLYRVHPEGDALELLYGVNSHQTGTNNSTIQFSTLAVNEAGKLIAVIRPYRHSQAGGDVTVIDAKSYVDFSAMVNGDTDELSRGQQSLSNNKVVTQEGVSLAGRYYSANPILDGTQRLVVSWTPCRLVNRVEDGELATQTIVPCTNANLANPDLEEAAPLYGLWVLDTNSQTQLPIISPQENAAFTEAIVIQPRVLPPANLATVNESLAEEGLGLVTIRSVYDIDGIDVTPSGLSAMADPLQTPPLQRPAQFIRLEKPVSQPDDDIADVDNALFGVAGNQLMREIIGYVPVEPDGSASFLVPADTAFALSITDSLGRRLTQRHQNWLQVRAGESMTCHGCHIDAATISHGRKDAQPASANAGATTTGLPFPNTEPALFADMGESMADTYRRIRGPRIPSVDLHFQDDWTDSSVAAKAESYSRTYRALVTPMPVTTQCLDRWDRLCRSVIHYEEHIQPLWSLSRQIMAEDGVTLVADHTCTACHADTDAEGLAQIPAAQLELSDKRSTDVPVYYRSYPELFARDFEQTLVDGALVDRTELVFDEQGNPVYLRDEEGELIVDAEGNPIQETERFSVRGPMSSAGALASNRFFDVFSAGASHDGWLSFDELRLIAEWLDIGGQYANDPFMAEAE